jgi:hypothetical protein
MQHRMGPRGTARAEGLSEEHARAALRALLALRLPLHPGVIATVEGGVRPAMRRTASESESPRACRARLRRLLKRLDARTNQRRPEPLRRCDSLAKLIGLGPVEAGVFALSTHGVFEQLLELAAAQAETPSRETLAVLLAAALPAPIEAVRVAIAPEGKLVRGSLVSLGDDCGGPRFSVGTVGMQWISMDGPAMRPVDALFTRLEPPDDTLVDFAHVGLDAEILRAQLRAALDGGTGVRVTLRGENGSGREALVRAIATELGATVWRASLHPDFLEADDLARLAVVALAEAQRPVLLVRGALDTTPFLSGPFLPGPFGRGPRRGRTDPRREAGPHDVGPREPASHEPVALPVVILTEPQENMMPPWLEMPEEPPTGLILQMPPLPPPLRVRALQRAAGFAAAHTPDWLRQAAERGVTAERLRGLAEDVARAGDLPPEVRERHLAHLVSREGRAPASPVATRPKSLLPYDLAWLRTDISADALVAALGRGSRGCMLFHGAPGTGKSALAEEIARRHGRPTVVRAASQLLSKYVGGTERNLAAAFTEAASRGALLILDEADSFLQPRRAAQRSWEVSQVNELLVQIERFEGWLVCTTNFLEGLDEAALRRFALKVRFEPPDATQRLALVRAASDALGLTWAGDDDACVGRLLAQATELTPGDVAAVVEQVQLLGGIEGPSALAERLVRETSLRRRPGGRVGFG